MKKALPWEARGKLPIDPSQALLRHLVARGEAHRHLPERHVRRQLDLPSLRDDPERMVAAWESAIATATDEYGVPAIGVTPADATALPSIMSDATCAESITRECAELGIRRGRHAPGREP